MSVSSFPLEFTIGENWNALYQNPTWREVEKIPTLPAFVYESLLTLARMKDESWGDGRGKMGSNWRWQAVRERENGCAWMWTEKLRWKLKMCRNPVVISNLRCAHGPAARPGAAWRHTAHRGPQAHGVAAFQTSHFRWITRIDRVKIHESQDIILYQKLTCLEYIG